MEEVRIHRYGQERIAVRLRSGRLLVDQLPDSVWFDPRTGQDTLAYGYDGTITVLGPDGENSSRVALTPEERREIADAMIAQINEWANR